MDPNISIKQEPNELSPYFNFPSNPPNMSSAEALDFTMKTLNQSKVVADSAEKDKSSKKSSSKKKKTNLNEDKNNADDGQTYLNELFKSKKRKIDRFNGLPEEEVLKRFLPDHLAKNLDILIIGINPGLVAAYTGHHYAGPGNHFWKCLFLSGLIPQVMNAFDDYKLLDLGIGFTNIVDRTTRGSADLTRKELKEGAIHLLQKIKQYQPKIAVFNGKVIYEVFSGKKDFYFGKQEEMIEGTSTLAFVMPSSSARCAQLPRAIDKVPFYQGLKKLRDHICGELPNLDFNEVVFPKLTFKVKQEETETLPPVVAQT